MFTVEETFFDYPKLPLNQDSPDLDRFTCYSGMAPDPEKHVSFPDYLDSGLRNSVRSMSDNENLTPVLGWN